MEVKENNIGNVYSQYCCLTTKNSSKNELMAMHSDDVYGSLQNISEFCNDQVETCKTRCYSHEVAGSTGWEVEVQDITMIRVVTIKRFYRTFLMHIA